MTSFTIYLIAPGAKRIKLIATVRRIRGITRAEAKSLVDSIRPAIATGTARYIATLRNELKELGAETEIATVPVDIEHLRWVSDTNSLDKRHCRHCGQPIFYAIPGHTTPEQIVEFANKASDPNSQEIARTRWIHPGAYCPSGCFFVMAEVELPDHPDKYP